MTARVLKPVSFEEKFLAVCGALREDNEEYFRQLIREEVQAQLQHSSANDGWPDYMTRPMAAKYLGVSLSQMEKMSRERWGPRCQRIGRAVRYSRKELDRWMNRNAGGSNAS
jgi:predicted DNA-binding transcriptional regulator AlpA